MTPLSSGRYLDAAELPRRGHFFTAASGKKRRHLSVRVEQKCHHTRFAEIRPPGDLLEGWCIGGGLALVEADHMARGAPPLRQPLSVRNVDGGRGSGDRDENSKGGNANTFHRTYSQSLPPELWSVFMLIGRVAAIAGLPQIPGSFTKIRYVLRVACIERIL
jgi:hypothetical protein